MRDVLIIGIACVAAILLGGWLYFSGTGPAPTSQAGEVAFSVLDSGTYSGAITERKNYRIKNQAELDELWRMTHGTGAPSNVDFAANEVIAVFDGTHATGGYGITIESVVDAQGARKVAILHTEPGADCITTSAITSPFQVVLLAKSSYALTHEDRTFVTECN